MVFAIINKIDLSCINVYFLWHSTPRLSENARKKVNIFQNIALKNFNSIESIFFDLQKFYISFLL